MLGALAFERRSALSSSAPSALAAHRPRDCYASAKSASNSSLLSCTYFTGSWSSAGRCLSFSFTLAFCFLAFAAALFSLINYLAVLTHVSPAELFSFRTTSGRFFTSSTSPAEAFRSLTGLGVSSSSLMFTYKCFWACGNTLLGATGSLCSTCFCCDGSFYSSCWTAKRGGSSERRALLIPPGRSSVTLRSFLFSSLGSLKSLAPSFSSSYLLLRCA